MASSLDGWGLRCFWRGVQEASREVISPGTDAVVVNSERITCPSPAWLEHEQTVTISLVNVQRDKVIDYVGDAVDARFAYVAEWDDAALQFTDGVATQVSRVLPMSGGGSVTVTGKGFDTASGTGLVCRFTCSRSPCSSSFVESAPPTVLNSSMLLCGAPAWTHDSGSAAALPVSLSMVRADGIALYASQGLDLLLTKASYIAPGTIVKSHVGGGVEITISGEGILSHAIWAHL